MIYTKSLLFALTVIVTGVLSLKNVSLIILPPAVERGLEAHLLCQYDLEGAPLYAVKWYRGVREFYRFSPNDHPPTKIFPYAGIHVDVPLSNASQVVLRQVGFNLSGNLSCEVTTDAPSFSTALVSKELTVIELPKRGPVLHTEKERYDVGDVLQGNCTSAPSKPAAVMRAFINSIPVQKPVSKSFPSGSGLQYTVLYLELRVEPAHMSNNGALILRCSSVVAERKLTVELSVGPRTSEPVPERVTSPSQSTQMLPCHLVVIILTPFLLR